MTETRWWKYMQSLMDGQSQLDAAKQIGISKSNITRWKDGARAAPDFVVKVARAYGANVLEALVEAEFITEKEAKLQQVRTGTPLEEATNQQILREILRRSGPEATYLFGMGDEQINPDADILDLPQRDDLVCGHGGEWAGVSPFPLFSAFCTFSRFMRFSRF